MAFYKHMLYNSIKLSYYIFICISFSLSFIENKNMNVLETDN